jgi:adenylate cyclase
VDDSEVLLGHLKNGLATQGWEVGLARTGLQALAEARRWVPDVVVCDLQMPIMDGFQVLRHLKSIDPTLPVVVLSGEDDLTSVLRAVREGAFDYVPKSSEDIRPLLAALDRALAHVRLARENSRLQVALKRANDELQGRLKQLAEQHQLLQQEQLKSASLLQNIFPRKVADSLRESFHKSADGRVSFRQMALRYSEVTVAFADLVDFTQLAAKLEPEQLVTVLNNIFSIFDRLAEKHGLEKIKTIGDAYMFAGGIPEQRTDHVERVAEMSLDMLAEIQRHNSEKNLSLAVRIGIAVGPVVAGVIGEKKFAYDLWGDTVNIASRMESQGVSGSIQVTEAIHERLKDRFLLEKRGKVAVKGRGEMVAYLLLKRKCWTGGR